MGHSEDMKEEQPEYFVFRTSDSANLDQSGSFVTIVRELSDSEGDKAECGRMFEIEFHNGDRIHVKREY